MYELLKKLRSHTDEFEELNLLIAPFILNGSSEITDAEIVSIESLCIKLEESDIFLLLEAIFFSANNFHENLIKELENRYTSIVQNWIYPYTLASELLRLFQDHQFAYSHSRNRKNKDCLLGFFMCELGV